MATSEGARASVSGVAARPAPGIGVRPNELAVDPSVLDRLGAVGGEAVVASRGEATAWATLRADSARPADDGGPTFVRLGRMLWAPLGAKPGDEVALRHAGHLPPATSVRITPPYTLAFHVFEAVRESLHRAATPLSPGSRVQAETTASRAGLVVRIDAVTPSPARLVPDTEIELHKPDAAVSERHIGFGDVGGVDAVVGRLRQLVELPLLRPGHYRRLGVRPPKGVLLHGPPGTGKTLTCKALANELGVTAFKLASTELVGSGHGETEANLRLLFSRALAHAPAMILIDELDVLATNRERLASQSDVRVTSQLLTLLDGLEEVDGVVLVGTTNRLHAIDPAFRRPGRFEEEIFVGPPEAEGRVEILAIHTRDMPLAASTLDALPAIARAAGGFVGADLMHLARLAGLAATARLAPGRHGFEAADVLDQQAVAVEPEDFDVAMGAMQASVLRDVAPTSLPLPTGAIVGLDAQRARLHDAAALALSTGPPSAPAQGVLLHGPPGSGKTALVDSIAAELGANLVAVEGSQVFNQWLGESEEALRSVFRRAIDAKPCVLVLDHLHALAPASSGAAGERTDLRVVSALLAAIDESAVHGGVLVIGVTPHPELVDPAVVRSGRLGLHVEVPAPDGGRRWELLVALTHSFELVLDEGRRDEVIAATEGSTAADLVLAVDRARQLAHARGVPLDLTVVLEAAAERSSLAT